MKYWNIIKHVWKLKIDEDKGYYYKDYNDSDHVWLLDGYAAWRFTKKNDDKCAEDECIFDLAKFKEFDLSGGITPNEELEDVTGRITDSNHPGLVKFETKTSHAYFREDLLKFFDKKDEFKLVESKQFSTCKTLFVFNDGQMIGMLLPVRVKDGV